MIVACPNCNRQVEQNSPPVRGPASDGSELWVCLKCPAVVCGHPIMKPDGSNECCYMAHIAKAHPEMYRGRPTAAGKKNKKGKR